MTQSGYSGYKPNNLFGGPSKAAQDLRIQTKQFNKAVKQAYKLSGFETLSGQIQVLEQRQTSLGYIYGLRKGLDIQLSSREKFLKLNGLSSRPKLTSIETILRQALDLRADLESTNESSSSSLTENKKTPNLSQQEISQRNLATVQKKTTIRQDGKNLKRVLVEIYLRLQREQKQSVLWRPSEWFGKRSTSWSNARNSLVDRGLVKKHYSRQYDHNPGNTPCYVSLTLEGCQVVKLLVQQNNEHSTGEKK